jgi:hypothetical protein
MVKKGKKSVSKKKSRKDLDEKLRQMRLALPSQGAYISGFEAGAKWCME